MADWQPNPEGLQQLVQLFSQSLIASQAVQKEIYQKLQEFHQIKDYNNYLIYIFAKLESTEKNVQIRVAAGLQLKNNVFQYYERFEPVVKQFIQREILVCLADQFEDVRIAAGQIISNIVGRGGLANWPGLMENLLTALSNPATAPCCLDGILSSLTMICEDSAYEMCDSKTQGGPENFEAILNVLIPTLVKYLSHEVPKFRHYALKSLNQFILFTPKAFLNNFEPFLKCVFILSNEASPKTRKGVCSSFVLLASARIDYILPFFDQIVPLLLGFTKDEDTEVSLEAAEFWNLISEYGVAKDALRPFLPNLLPVLLERMVFSEDDQELLASEEQDTSVPDAAQDKNPVHYKSTRGENLTEFEDDDEDEDDLDGEGYMDWNIRKCCAATLDFLSELYQSEILPFLIPLIEQKMNTSNHWSVYESIILAFGAIAKGCYRAMCDLLPKLLPFFFEQLKHPQVLVRNIACWSISRYSAWITQQDPSLYLEPFLARLLELMLDRKKSVQQAACTALTHLQEKTRVVLIRYIQPIVSAFLKASQLYQTRNLLILFDSIGIFSVVSVKACQDKATIQQFAKAVTPRLLEVFGKLADDDKEICHLIECLIDVFSSCGLAMQEYAVPVFNRALQLIDTNLVFLADNRGERHDSDFIIAGLNLLSTMTESFGQSMESLVGNSNLVGLIYRCMKENSRIRQETFALLGDLCPYCMPHMVAVVNVLIPEVVLSIAPPGRSSGNACWALGMVMRYTSDQIIAPFAPKILEALVRVLNSERLSKELMENAAISLGWLANRSTATVAEVLGTIFQNWCFALTSVVEAEEKTFAFFGFCKAIQTNPRAIFNQNLVYLFGAIAGWDAPCEELSKQFHHLLHEFKKLAPKNDWDALMENVDDAIASRLSVKYNI